MFPTSQWTVVLRHISGFSREVQCIRKVAVHLGIKICSVSWSPTHA
jgi:hypothetical protein